MNPEHWVEGCVHLFKEEKTLCDEQMLIEAIFHIINFDGVAFSLP